MEVGVKKKKCSLNDFRQVSQYLQKAASVDLIKMSFSFSGGRICSHSTNKWPEQNDIKA